MLTSEKNKGPNKGQTQIKKPYEDLFLNVFKGVFGKIKNPYLETISCLNFVTTPMNEGIDAHKKFSKCLRTKTR